MSSRNKVNPQGGRNISGWSNVRPGRGNNTSAWAPPSNSATDRIGGGAPMTSSPRPKPRPATAKK